jgi:hypothetical protein
MGRAVYAVPPRFDIRGQNVNRTGTGGRSATDRERDGSQAKVSRAMARMTAAGRSRDLAAATLRGEIKGIDLFHI